MLVFDVHLSDEDFHGPGFHVFVPSVDGLTKLGLRLLAADAEATQANRRVEGKRVRSTGVVAVVGDVVVAVVVVVSVVVVVLVIVVAVALWAFANVR